MIKDFTEHDQKFTSWLYNVRDEYKPLSKEEIKTKLAENHLPLSVLMSQVAGDFNFASVIRSANGFGIKEIYYYGNKKYDRRGAVGAYHYIDVRFLSSSEEIKNLKNKYLFVGLENNIERSPIELSKFSWPKKETLLLIGEESCGLSTEILDLCDHLVEINMRGSIRSFNAASAASIAMYDYCSKYEATCNML